MRKLLAFFCLLVVVPLAACSNATTPERRTLVGSWSSFGFARADVQMTLSEVARAVEGAGSWLEPDQAMAFRAAGAHADGVISLLFEFEDAPDINFRGEFTDEDQISGTLTGGSFRNQPITFLRVEEKD